LVRGCRSHGNCIGIPLLLTVLLLLLLGCTVVLLQLHLHARRGGRRACHGALLLLLQLLQLQLQREWQVSNPPPRRPDPRHTGRPRRGTLAAHSARARRRRSGAAAAAGRRGCQAGGVGRVVPVELDGLAVKHRARKAAQRRARGGVRRKLDRRAAGRAAALVGEDLGGAAGARWGVGGVSSAPAAAGVEAGRPLLCGGSVACAGAPRRSLRTLQPVTAP
jgi:hypothetical protein